MSIAIIFTLLGLTLIYTEFFLPGVILGVLGGGLIVSSIFMLAYQKMSLTFVIVYSVISISLVIITTYLALKKVKKSKDIFLNEDQSGFQASEFNKKLIGKTAEAATDLKPSGHIYINDNYYVASSKKDYIKKGEKIKIIAGEGAHLIVQLFKKEK